MEVLGTAFLVCQYWKTEFLADLGINEPTVSIKPNPRADPTVIDEIIDGPHGLEIDECKVIKNVFRTMA
jgi:hypothetical protein